MFESVAPENLTWLWRHRIPLGMVTIFAGEGGRGKSTCMLDIAARVTTGRPMPDGSGGGEPAGVIWLSAEDPVASVLVPRLTLAGADLGRVVAVSIMAGEGDMRDPVIAPGDLSEIECAAREHGARLVVFDPMVAYVDDATNLHHNQDARRVMARLYAFATRASVAVVGIHHFNRGQHVDAIHRLTGSAGLANAARSALVVAPDPDDPTGERTILALAKTNLAPRSTPSLAYRLEVPDGGEHPRVVWDGMSSLSANEVMATPADPEERSAMDDAVGFLQRVLAGGPLAAKDGEAQARAEGIAARTLERARRRLHVVAERPQNPGPWYWRLPHHEWRSGGVPLSLSLREREERELVQTAQTARADRPDRPDRLAARGGGGGGVAPEPLAAEDEDGPPLTAEEQAMLDHLTGGGR